MLRCLSTLCLVVLLLISSTSSTSAQKVPIMSQADGRDRWPEFVGMPGEEVSLTLKASHPDWKIQVVPEGSMVTMDYRTDRVRVWVDADGKVTKAPTIG